MVNTDWGVYGFCSWGHGVTEGRDLPLTSPLSSYVLPRHVRVKTCEHRVILLPHESGDVSRWGGRGGGVEGGCALITVTQMFVWYWFVAVLWVEARGEGQKYLYQRTSPPPTSPWYHRYTCVCVWVCSARRLNLKRLWNHSNTRGGRSVQMEMIDLSLSLSLHRQRQKTLVNK